SRRIPYDLAVTRPALARSTVVRLVASQRGDTRTGRSRVALYRYPSAPFGLPARPGAAPMDESGGERVYAFTLRRRVVNFGVVVTDATPGARIDPFVLGSLDESDVEGYAGTPTAVNELSDDFGEAIGAAGLFMPL